MERKMGSICLVFVIHSTSVGTTRSHLRSYVIAPHCTLIQQPCLISMSLHTCSAAGAKNFNKVLCVSVYHVYLKTGHYNINFEELHQLRGQKT